MSDKIELTEAQFKRIWQIIMGISIGSEDMNYHSDYCKAKEQGLIKQNSVELAEEIIRESFKHCIYDDDRIELNTTHIKILKEGFDSLKKQQEEEA